MLLNINTPLKTYRHLTDILVYYTKVVFNIKIVPKQIDLYAVSTYIYMLSYCYAHKNYRLGS